jgi:class 3 adenylate cyclase
MPHRSRHRKPRTADTIPEPGVPFSAVIMFVDIRDSTTLTNQLGIMPMTRLVAQFFASVASLVEDEDGSVRSLNGDGALALFRGPGAADRSLAAAVRILELAAATVVPGAKAVGSLVVGIGIDQGQVCQALIPCSTAPQQSWVGVNTANKLAGVGRPAQSITMTKEVFTDIASQANGAHLLQSAERTVRVGNVDRVVRTRTASRPVVPSVPPVAPAE